MWLIRLQYRIELGLFLENNKRKLGVKIVICLHACMHVLSARNKFVICLHARMYVLLVLRDLKM